MSICEIEMGRRRLFWDIKKWASYTVWEHYAHTFDEFVKAYEDAVATWPKGEAPPDENLKYAYEAQELYPLGLAALRKGDRNVWRERDDGYLSDAAFAASKAMNGITDEYTNELEGGERGVPKYTVWTQRLEQLRLLKERASPAGGVYVFERVPIYADWKATAFIEHDPEPWANSSLDHDPGLYDTVPYDCPPTPEVRPESVKSGERVTHSGIWEQVVPGLPVGQTEALNYFIKGTQAPWIDVFNEADGPGQQTVEAVAWRLVWEDTRYLDGVIPVESEYLNDYSAEPEAVPPSETATVEPQTGRVGANKPCPQAGFWWTPAKENSRHYFDRGVSMPDFPDSSYGATIWYWDQQQG